MGRVPLGTLQQLVHRRPAAQRYGGYGDYTGGPRIVTEATRQEMKKMLAEIQSGEFAKTWITENAAGRPWFSKQREIEAGLKIEEVGERLRGLMPFLKPVTIKQSQPVSSTR
jgi:ketol-acid reductoisomerase